MLHIFFTMAHRELKPGTLSTALNCLNNVIAHPCISINLVCCSEATSLIFRCNLGRIDFQPAPQFIAKDKIHLKTFKTRTKI